MSSQSTNTSIYYYISRPSVYYDVQHASTPWIQSQLVSGERSNLFKLHTIGDGTVYNKEYKVSIFNVKAAGSSNATDYATFSLMIRGYLIQIRENQY